MTHKNQAYNSICLLRGGIYSATEPRLSPHTQPRRPHKSVNTLVAEEGSWPQLSYSLLKTKVEKSAGEFADDDEGRKVRSAATKV